MGACDENQGESTRNNLDLNVEKMYNLALKPHLHDLESCEASISLLLNPTESLYKRGLSIWILGRIFQLHSDPQSNSLEKKRHLENEILKKSSEIMNAAIEVMGEVKLRTKYKIENTNPNSSNRSIGDIDLKSIFKNSSLLILILTDLSQFPSLKSDGNPTSFTSNHLFFSRMSRVPESSTKLNNSALKESGAGIKNTKKPPKSKNLRGTGDTKVDNKKSISYKYECTNSNPTVKRRTPLTNKQKNTMVVNEMREVKNSKSLQISSKFIPNEEHESQAKGIYSNMKKNLVPKRTSLKEARKKEPYCANVYSQHRLRLKTEAKTNSASVFKVQKNVCLKSKSTIRSDNIETGDQLTERERRIIILEGKSNDTIKLNCRKLPSSFLASSLKAHEYYSQRLHQVFITIVVLFNKVQINIAMHRWKQFVDKSIRHDDDQRFRREAGARGLKAIIVEFDIKLYRNNFAKWKENVHRIISKERYHAAIILQCAFFRFQSVCKFLSIHKAYTINGPLADIYLAPQRFHITFFISPTVRKERRHRWFSTILIQSIFRMTSIRKSYLRFKQKLIILQSYRRLIMEKRNYMNLHSKLVKLQSTFRMSLQRSLHSKETLNAIKIQALYREIKATGQYKNYKKSISKIQMAFRLLKARNVVKAIKKQNKIEFLSALRIQRAWYTKNGEFSTFFLLGCLRETEQIEIKLKQEEKGRYRAAKATLLQSRVRDFLKRKKSEAAQVIQSNYRYYAANSRLFRIIKENCCCCMIQRIWKNKWIQKNEAATKIMFFWIWKKKGRLLNHIKLVMQEQQRKAAMNLFKHQVKSSIILQKSFRRLLSQIFYKSLKTASRFTILVSMYHSHQIKLEKMRVCRARISSHFCERVLRTGEENVVMDFRDTLKEVNNLSKVFWNNVVIQTENKIDYCLTQKYDKATRQIQYYYRHFSKKQQKTLEILIEKRKAVNPYNALHRIVNIVKLCFQSTHFLWNPREERCGMYLPDFMQRIGLLKDIYPILVNNSIYSTEQLYSMTETDLCKIGIVDANKSSKNSVADAMNVRTCILELSKFSPYAGLKEYGTQKILNQAVIDDNKYANEFNIIPRDIRESRTKEIFIEYYGAKNMVKAENFASKKELIDFPISTLQLRRFFSFNQNPRKAKENISDLLILADNFNGKDEIFSSLHNRKRTILSREPHKYQDVSFVSSDQSYHEVMLDRAEWEIKRMYKCIDSLLFAAERILDFTHHEQLQVLVKRSQRYLLLSISGSNHDEKSTKKISQQLHNLLVDLFNMDSATLAIQQRYRIYFSRKTMSVMRHHRAIRKANEDYLYNRNFNFVRQTWLGLKIEEEEEYRKKYLIWMEKEHRSRIEDLLQRIPRYGWKSCHEMTSPAEVKGGLDLNIYKSTNESFRRVSTQEHKMAVYSYEEYLSAQKLIQIVRIFLAKACLSKLRRQKRRSVRISRDRHNWDQNHKTFVMFINLHNSAQSHENVELASIKQKEFFPTVPIRFGWDEISKTSLNGYINIKTKKVSCDPEILLYDFEEYSSAKMIQTAWRGKAGRKEFRMKLNEENIFNLVNRTIELGKEISWIGFGIEGMSFRIWLARLGLSEFYDQINDSMLNSLKEFTKSKCKELRTLNSKQKNENILKGKAPIKYSCNTDEGFHFTIDDFLRKSSDEEWLRQSGIKEKKDREMIKQMRLCTTEIHKYNFLNYYLDENDPRSIQNCIEDSHDLLYNLVMKKFKNNPSRVKQMVDDMTKSRFPITTYQIERFLNKYEGKPALAQKNVKEITDIQTTSVAAKENDVYNIYKKSVDRILILLRNCGIHDTADYVEGKSNKACEVLQDDVEFSNKENEKNFLSDLQSGNQAKAALILRKDVLSFVLQIWGSCIIVQKYFRSYIQMNKYQRNLSMRYECAAKLQNFARSYFARSYSILLRKQKHSSWEQLWSDAAQVFYWYNRESEIASWEEPKDPYRPMVMHRLTQKLIKAWPMVDELGSSNKSNSSKNCHECKVNIATRYCSECEKAKNCNRLNDISSSRFCFICFNTYHCTKKELRSHRCIIIEQEKPSSLVCCMCQSPSTRRCLGIQIKKSSRKRLSQLINCARDENKEFIDFETFKKTILQDLKISMSMEWIAATYKNCCSDNIADTWELFRLLIDNIGKDCDENFCDGCWEIFHSKGARLKHEWIGYKEHAIVCVECRKHPANMLCLSCRDELCIFCSEKIHSSGNRRNHKFEKIIESKESDDDNYCSTCSIRVASEKCEMCQAHVCNSCSIFSHKRNCRLWRRMKTLGCENIICSVCNEPADLKCRDCGEVYCNNQLTGRLDCFEKMHQKGNRLHHKKMPYKELQIFHDELKRQNEEREDRQRKKEKNRMRREEKKAAAKAMNEKKTIQRMEMLKEKAYIEFQRIQLEETEAMKKNSVYTQVKLKMNSLPDTFSRAFAKYSKIHTT